MDTGNFAWLAYSFDVNEFMSNDQPIVQHELNTDPLSYHGPGQAQGDNSQVCPRQDSTSGSNTSSSPPMPTPELPALARNQSLKQQTAKSPKRNSTMSGIGASDHRFTCQLCSFSTNTKRDYTRHLETRKHRNNANIGFEGMDERPTGFHCPVPDCKYSAATGGEMFSREDNLWRHIRTIHKIKKQG